MLPPTLLFLSTRIRIKAGGGRSRCVESESLASEFVDHEASSRCDSRPISSRLIRVGSRTASYAFEYEERDTSTR